MSQAAAFELVQPLLPETAKSADAASSIRVSEIISALSYALDLTEGRPMGHSVRSCMIGLRLARQIGLSAAEQGDLYYALLLKDAGCSSNAICPMLLNKATWHVFE